MSDHFSAFSFVDRITEVQPGLRARGQFATPDGLQDFPACLVAEAVGQLAAWASMAAVAFHRRPVAGLAGHVEILGDAQPGQILDLETELQGCDSDAVAYQGWAHAGGSPLLRLSHCVGPMLPMEEFDDPQAVRDHFALLCGAGAAPGRFPGVSVPQLLILDGSPGEGLRATMQIPASAPYFADHFPWRPVFPGSLLLEAQLRLAAQLARRVLPQAPGLLLVPSHVSDVKLRAFLSPGQAVEIEAKMHSGAGSRRGAVAVAVRANGKQVASARVALTPRDSS